LDRLKTNRGENCHQLKRSVAFANFGKLRFRSEYERNISNECSRLLTNCILYYNSTILSELLKNKEKNHQLEEIEIIKQISLTAWQHINFMRRCEFNQKQKDIDISEIIKGIKLLSISQPKIHY